MRALEGKGVWAPSKIGTCVFCMLSLATFGIAEATFAQEATGSSVAVLGIAGRLPAFAAVAYGAEPAVRDERRSPLVNGIVGGTSLVVGAAGIVLGLQLIDLSGDGGRGQALANTLAVVPLAAGVIGVITGAVFIVKAVRALRDDQGETDFASNIRKVSVKGASIRLTF